MGLYPKNIQAPIAEKKKKKGLFFNMDKNVAILQQLKGNWGHTKGGVRSAGTNLTVARLLNEIMKLRMEKREKCQNLTEFTQTRSGSR